ncbi:hypothetical protein KsCSTR_31290 [Candidatus Kuenenia stuttgartiensis]|uniref:Uncharacterized protein n=1 Tax=Kuenenia stuttgartiensis TaxID=174633 RepID=Q1Q4Z3_KUEST|nr:hypothetical protein KsCSTR_31290 [Candidatus Kuenenia stuttgartiensis]CAJ75092.1 unknown protein [Candidatus Kuenenia stuttgartiensis]
MPQNIKPFFRKQISLTINKLFRYSAFLILSGKRIVLIFYVLSYILKNSRD